MEKDPWSDLGAVLAKIYVAKNRRQAPQLFPESSCQTVVDLLVDLEPALDWPPEWLLWPVPALELLRFVDWKEVQRWGPRLEPIFAKLKCPPVSPSVRRPRQFPFLFDSAVVFGILGMGFIPGMIDCGLTAAKPSTENLIRKAGDILKLWRGASSPSHQEALAEMLADTLAALVVHKRRKRRLSKKCPTLSVVITALITYLVLLQDRFWGNVVSCFACDIHHYSSGP